MEMLGFAATWRPHDVIGNLMMVFTLLALLDDDMWPLEGLTSPYVSPYHVSFSCFSIVESVLKGWPHL